MRNFYWLYSSRCFNSAYWTLTLVTLLVRVLFLIQEPQIVRRRIPRWSTRVPLLASIEPCQSPYTNQMFCSSGCLQESRFRKRFSLGDIELCVTWSAFAFIYSITNLRAAGLQGKFDRPLSFSEQTWDYSIGDTWVCVERWRLFGSLKQCKFNDTSISLSFGHCYLELISKSSILKVSFVQHSFVFDLQIHTRLRIRFVTLTVSPLQVNAQINGERKLAKRTR